jgi:hypothetical protein
VTELCRQVPKCFIGKDGYFKGISEKK